MSECTQPELWASRPRSDASEEEVARYLAHVDQCSFHAELEDAKDRSVRGIAAFAVGDLAAVSQEKHAIDSRTIRHLAIRVDGLERVVLNLLQDSSVTINVPEGSLVGVWSKDQDGISHDIHLASHVSASGDSKTVLEDGQTISFTSPESRNEITVAYAETKWSRAIRLSLARVEYQLGFRGGELRWATALKLAGVIALLAAMLLLPLYFLRNKPSVERANVPREEHSPSPSSSPEVITQQDPTPAPSVNRNVNNNRQAPASIANVKRIYVAEAEGEYNQLLRTALINELRQSGRFTVVTRADEADAVFETESTRGPNVRVQLLDRAGKALWFTMQSTSDESGTGARDAASRIVRALKNEAAPPGSRN